jgi:antitoxin MazE
MIKKLSAIGNSLGIIIERPILELLNIDRDTPLDVSTDGEALIIRPTRMEQKERVKASAARMMDAHNETLRKLAE